MWNRNYASLVLTSALLVSLGTATAHPTHDRELERMCVSLGGHVVRDGKWLIGRFDTGIVTVTNVRTGKMITIDERGAIYGIGLSGHSFVIEASRVRRKELRELFPAMAEGKEIERIIATYSNPSFSPTAADVTTLSSLP